MNKRLLLFLQAENITQAQFADTLNVARGSVSHILSGRNKPGYEFLESLALHYPALNIDWLLTGKGSMSKDASLWDSASQASPEPELFIPQQSGISHITVFFTDNTYKVFKPEE